MRDPKTVLASACLVVVVSCGSDAEVGQRPKAESPAPAATPDAAVDSAPPDASISELKLPHHDVDVPKVLYGTVDEVRVILGRGAPRKFGRWQYDLGDGESVVVVFDHGRAVGIEMPTASSRWGYYDAGQRAALRAWGHLGDGEGGEVRVRGHSLVAVKTLVDTGLAIYDEEYWKRETAKVEAENAKVEAAARAKADAAERAAAAKAEREQRAAAERERRMRPAREGFVEQFAAMAATKGNLGFNVELGSPDTTLRIVGPCNGPILHLVADTAGEHIRNVGFTRLECASSSSTWITP